MIEILSENLGQNGSFIACFPRACQVGQFEPELVGQFDAEWWVSFSRNYWINLGGFSIETSRTESISNRVLAGTPQRDASDISVFRYINEIGDTVSFYANDTMLWYDIISDTVHRAIHLMKPLVVNAHWSFDELKVESRSSASIHSVNAPLTVSRSTYKCIRVVSTDTDALSSDTLWFGEGLGILKRSLVLATLYSSGKRSLLLATWIPTAIVKP